MKRHLESVKKDGLSLYVTPSLRAASPTVSAEEDGEKEERRKISPSLLGEIFLLSSFSPSSSADTVGEAARRLCDP